MRVGELFAGIGGLGLGLERAGMEIVWQVEIDPYATKVLEKHWPNVTRFRDVRECGAHNLPPVDLIVGGFPCQDVSLAGARAGITGTRSGLWKEYSRIIRELRPRFILVENVPGLLSGGMGEVLGDLAESGYDAEWDCIPACSVSGGAHCRDRVWIVAHTYGRLCIMEGRPQGMAEEGKGTWFERSDPSEFLGVVDGLPSRVDRLRCLGNAVVPQVAEWLGRRILEFSRMG